MKPFKSNNIYRTVYRRSRQLIADDLNYSSLKIVIRRLPPDMDKNTFLKQISPVPSHDYFYFVKADMQHGKFAFCRAYVNFIDEKDLLLFKEKFDGYIILNSKGIEYPAVVEYAPSVRVPKNLFKYSLDPNCNTIDMCYSFNKFVNSFTNDQICLDRNVNYDSKLIKPENDSKNITSLLTYIKRKRQEKSKTNEEGWKTKPNFKESGSYMIIRNSKRIY